MIWSISISIWKTFSNHWQVLSKDARNPEEENANICGLEVNLEWQVESTIDYMCNTCDEGKGLKVGEDGKYLNGRGNLFLQRWGNCVN